MGITWLLLYFFRDNGNLPLLWENLEFFFTPDFSYNINDNEKYYPGEPVNMYMQPLMHMVQENNRVITTKNGKDKLPFLCGNGEWVIPIYDRHTVERTWKRWISVKKRECNTQKKYSKHIGRPYLLKDSNEITILADCTENRLGLRYTTSLINCHRKTQGFDAVCKSTANPDFKIIQPKKYITQHSTRYKEWG